MAKKTLVIVPFTNVSKKPEDEYFSDGITDELLIALNKIRGVKTASRTSCYYLKNKSLTIGEIAEALGVDYILEGSVRKTEDAARITVQLIEIENETVLLSEVYETQLNNIFQVQSGIALKISEQLKGVFDDTSYTRSLPGNSKAYDLYLKGNYHWYRYTKEEMELAIACFNKAIKLEPEFALAHSGLAKAYIVLGGMGYSQANIVFPKAKAAAKKALLFNNKLVEPHLSFSWVNLFYDWDLAKARKHLDLCLRLNPNHAAIYDTFCKYYFLNGQLMKAEEAALRAIELDPMVLTYHGNLIRIYTSMGKYDEALTVSDGSLEIDPSFLPAFHQKGWVYVFLGEFDKAIEIFEDYKAKSNNSIESLSGLGFAYARAGFIEESHDCLKTIKSKQKGSTAGAIEFECALVNIGLRNYDAVYRNIENSIKSRLGIIVAELVCNPVFHELKSEQRFVELFQTCIQAESGLFPEELNDTRQPSIIQIVSNTSEKLLMDPNDLLYVEADDNYAKVFWKDGSGLNEKLLRVTLNQLEKQLKEFEFIIRCHKSFIINVKEDYTISGNAKGYKFKSVLSPYGIPVSRPKAKMVIEHYEKFHP
ncbi:MAG: tetratricopeptide repeat protein [Flavobacteriales bacterium]|nr:tetratricopeptide repeat protein [Flavobacteriales bacterium]